MKELKKALRSKAKLGMRFQDALEKIAKEGEEGSIDAIRVLGDVYYFGRPEEKIKIDEEKAIHFYKKASLGGDRSSEQMLTAIYMNNSGE